LGNESYLQKDEYQIGASVWRPVDRADEQHAFEDEGEGEASSGMKSRKNRIIVFATMALVCALIIALPLGFVLSLQNPAKGDKPGMQ